MWTSMWAGVGVGVASAIGLGWLAAQPSARLLCWVVIGVALVVALASAVRLLLQLPIIEASELGIAVWFHGPYRRPFFAPWKRVRAVVLTRVRAMDAPRAGVRDALGIELDRDERSPLPIPGPGADAPIEGAARADIVWSRRLIAGDLRRWVEVLQQMKQAYTAPSE
jgi:hypothetical protein